MSASPLPRSLRLTRQVTRGVLLAATAGTGVLGVHLASDHHARGTAAPTLRTTSPTGVPTPAATPSAAVPTATTTPGTATTTTPAAPATTTPAAPRTTAPPAPRFTPVAPVAPAAGSGTGGGTTSGS